MSRAKCGLWIFVCDCSLEVEALLGSPKLELKPCCHAVFLIAGVAFASDDVTPLPSCCLKRSESRCCASPNWSPARSWTSTSSSSARSTGARALWRSTLRRPLRHDESHCLFKHVTIWYDTRNLSTADESVACKCACGVVQESVL